MVESNSFARKSRPRDARRRDQGRALFIRRRDNGRWIQRFDHFSKAFLQLQEAVQLARQRPLSKLEAQGLIQVFEFTHELAWNTLKDFLENRVDTAILYGSRAMGNDKPGSDIDLTLGGSEDLSLDVVYSILNALDDLLLPYTIDLSILDDINDPDVIEHIQRVGVEFYAKSRDAVELTASE